VHEAADTGAVDQHIQASQFLPELIDRCRPLRFLRDVKMNERRFSALVPDRPTQYTGLLIQEVCYDY
jgi:hypothetical protein